jgi:transcriptional regulator of acetoin/glycerol metabolism
VVDSVLHTGQRHASTSHSNASALLDLRRNAVIDAYRKNAGNISKTAQQLSVSRNTVYRELRKAGMGPKDEEDPDLES